MTDPKRWLDESGAMSNEERALLQAGRDDRMPNALRERVWLGVTAGVAATAAPGAAAALHKAAAAKGVLSFLTGSAVKGVLAVALVGGVGLGVMALRPSTKLATGSRLPSSLAPAPKATPIALPVDEPREVADRAPAEPSIPLPAATSTRSRAVDTPRSSARTEDARPAEGPSEAREASRLREESAAVLAARKALVSGDAAGALRMLDRARIEFPNGALAEDREALTIRALALGGQKDAARSRGEAFLRAFPRSPYASEIRAAVDR